MQDPNNPETKFFVTPDGTTYQTTVNHCTGHRYATLHCWHLEKVWTTTLLYKCCECGKHQRRYKPGMKPTRPNRSPVH
jgi:predicted SprT family Zn-dependent metalloprotease